MADRFKHMTSNEAQTFQGVWSWMQRFVTELNKLKRLWELADMDLTGQAGKTVKVKADESGFELV